MSKQKNKDEKHATLGLKVRRSEGPETPVVNKPRKMNLVKPKRLPAKTDEFANSAMLVFPTDRMGIATGVKAELIRAASRVGGDEDTLAILKETVEIGMKHVEARMKQNQELPKLKQRVNTKNPEEDAPADAEPAGTPSETETKDEVKEKTPTKAKKKTKAKGKK